MLNSDQLGEKGQHRFAEICSDAKLICNRSTYDRTGWDFIVEFPFGRSFEKSSLDKRRIPISCHVQVKTMWSSNDSFRIRLSSAERLAKEPKPAFIYVLKINEKLDFVEAYLVHVIDDSLATILKRLRHEHSKSGDSARLNRKYISFRPSQAGQSLPPTGGALREALEALCGPDSESYMVKKQNQLKTLGFELRPFHAKTKILIEGKEAFVEAFLGLRKVEFVEWEAFETRFGIKLPLNDLSSSKGTLHIQPGPADNCTISIRETALSPPVLFEGEVFFPAIPNLPRDELKFLIKSKLFHFLVDRKGAKFETTENIETTLLKIREWIDFFKALIVFSKGSGTLTITPKKFPPASMPFKGKGNFELTNLTNLLKICESAQKLLYLAGIDPLVGLASLTRHADQIAGLDELFSGGKNLSTIRCNVEPPADTQLPEKLTVIIAGYILLPTTALAFYGIAELAPETRTGRGLWKSKTLEPREIVVLANFPSGYKEFIDGAKAKEKIDNVLMAEAQENSPNKLSTLDDLSLNDNR